MAHDVFTDQDRQSVCEMREETRRHRLPIAAVAFNFVTVVFHGFATLDGDLGTDQAFGMVDRTLDTLGTDESFPSHPAADVPLLAGQAAGHVS